MTQKSHNEPKQGANHKRSLRWLSRGPQVMCLIAAPLIAYRWHDEGIVIVGLIVAYLVLAALLNSWVIFCTTMGALLGFTTDSTPKGGTAESQIIETIVSVGCGTLVGFVIGIIADFMRSTKRLTAPIPSLRHESQAAQRRSNSNSGLPT